MPTPSPTLTPDEAADLIGRALRSDAPGRGSVGLEVEWIVVDPAEPARAVPGREVLDAVAGPLPGGGTVGVEPGGQLELTTARHVDAPAALAAAEADEAVLRRRAVAGGLVLLATGFDPFRRPHRSLDRPRYRAMEAAFDARGPAGRVMMCSTAALQVNVDFGADPRATFTRASLVAPVLAAAFANSPRLAPDGTVVASARSLVWAAVDPGRTRPAPVDGWPRYALAADVLYVRAGGDAHPVPAPFPLSRWVAQGHTLGWPDEADVIEHLTTLFPPVRPRGWLECRFLDTLAPDDRRAAVSALVTLVGDDAPVDQLGRICDGVDDPWSLVPTGLADPSLRASAEASLALAADLLDMHPPVGTSTGPSPADATGGDALRAWAERRRRSGWAVAHPDLLSHDSLEQEIP